MITKLKYLAGICLFAFCTAVTAGEVPIIIENDLTVNTYPGVESILLEWEAPSDVSLRTVRIYRTLDLSVPYTILTESHSQLPRFLDTAVVADQRYFYYLEWVGQDGLIHTSSKDTPAFTRPLNPEVLKPQTLFRNMDSRRFTQFLYRVFGRQLNRLIDPRIADLASLLRLENPTPRQVAAAISIRGFNSFTRRQLIRAFTAAVTRTDSLLIENEPYLRNLFLLTPEEWASEIRTFRSTTNGRFMNLIDIIERIQERLAARPNLRISAIHPINPDSLGVEVQVLRYGARQVQLSDGATALGIAIPRDLPPRQTYMAYVPGSWRRVAVISDQLNIDQIPVATRYGAYRINLFNEIFPDSLAEDWTDASDIRLNEWQYDPVAGELRVELLVPAEAAGTVVLQVNDSLVWEESVAPALEVQFITTTLPVPSLDETAVWLTRNTKDEFGRLHWSESCLVPVWTKSHEARFPDGDQWQSDKRVTLGSSNEQLYSRSAELLIPEVFALYQNYPNPFNAGTTLSFEMLQPAKVSLFVTDATGRVIETFLEQTPLTYGNYSFQWQGRTHSSGVYFFTIVAEIDDFLPVSFSRKMIYLK